MTALSVLGLDDIVDVVFHLIVAQHFQFIARNIEVKLLEINVVIELLAACDRVNNFLVNDGVLVLRGQLRDFSFTHSFKVIHRHLLFAFIRDVLLSVLLHQLVDLVNELLLQPPELYSPVPRSLEVNLPGLGIIVH